MKNKKIKLKKELSVPNQSEMGKDIDLASESSNETAIATDEEGHYDVDGSSLVEHKKYNVVIASDAGHVRDSN
jgi:hypothetical protein